MGHILNREEAQNVDLFGNKYGKNDTPLVLFEFKLEQQP